MGNHSVGEAFAAAADVFWSIVPSDPAPTKDVTLKALDLVGSRFRGADAEFDDELLVHTTPLGRMVALAFDATPEEKASSVGDNDDDDGDAWYSGPYSRFCKHFEFC